MAEDPELGKRLRAARNDWERRHDRRLTDREIGERMQFLLARDKPIKSQVVNAWIARGQEPEDFLTFAALAAVLEHDPGALAFTGLRTENEVLLKAETRRLQREDAEKLVAKKVHGVKRDRPAAGKRRAK